MCVKMTSQQHSITLVHSTTNQSLSIDIDKEHPFIPALQFRNINVTPENPPPSSADDFVGLTIYDPGFLNTVSCRSKISLVDGNTGKLYYRGYSIEDLFSNASFTEVAYLLIYGNLPTNQQFDAWQSNILRHTYLHVEMERQLETFRWDSHPMGMLIASLSSLSSLHPDANPALVGDALYTSGPRDQFIPFYKLGGGSLDPSSANPTSGDVCEYIRNKQVYRIFGKIHTIAANVYRHREGRPYNSPLFNPRSITENFLYMLDKLNEPDYVPDPALVDIMDKAFILLAEHGSSCSTIMMRHLISSGVDPCTAISGACGTLFGERKAGAVIDMLESIHTVDMIPKYLEAVTHKHAKFPRTSKKLGTPLKLMGWGHRIYKGSATDPRVALMRQLAFQCFRHVHTGSNPESPSNHFVYLAIQLEKTVLADEFFVSRNLNPNIDYWTAILFHTMGFPKDMFPVLMSIPRSVGYLAHFLECVNAKEQIYRPRQLYQGPALCDFVPVNNRAQNDQQKGNDALPVGPTIHESMSLRSNPSTNLRRINPKSTNLQDVNAQIIETRHEIDKLAKQLDANVQQGHDNLVPATARADGGGSPRTLKQWISSVQKRVTKSSSDIRKGVASEPLNDQAAAAKLDQKRVELQELVDLQQELVGVQNKLKDTTLE